MTTDTDTDTTATTTTEAATLTVDAVTFDCGDALTVATFWSAVLHRPLADGSSSSWASLPGVPALTFNAVPEPRERKNRVHLDLAAGDRGAEVARLVGLGATLVAEHDEHGFQWSTLQDVEGNEFCVS